MLSRRRTFIALLTALAASLPTSAQTKRAEVTAPRTVVFVCEHGAAKSVIAAAHFNELAKKRGLPHRAIARGTHPDAEFPAKILTALRTEGLSASEGKPELLGNGDVQRASQVVALGCKLPEKVRATNWSDIPSVSEDYAGASRYIRSRVERLVNELSDKSK
jgi:arsenate reductase (thioredoxin)